MSDLDETLVKFRALNLVMSLEEERDLLYSYVYFTNKLEGNKLTLAQTSQLLSTDTISGNNIRTKDILEQKGMYKALVRMLKAVHNNEELSSALLLELNWLSIDTLWKSDDAYLEAKGKGQKPDRFKMSQNYIQIRRGGKVVDTIEPISDPSNVRKNIDGIINEIKASKAPVVKKAAYLAQELWIHQPFVDGNKRAGRLAVNFLTMKEGFPLFIYDDGSKNYNALLVEQYYDKRTGLITDYIENELMKKMKQSLNLTRKKGDSSGFRIVL